MLEVQARMQVVVAVETPDPGRLSDLAHLQIAIVDLSGQLHLQTRHFLPIDARLVKSAHGEHRHLGSVVGNAHHLHRKHGNPPRLLVTQALVEVRCHLLAFGEVEVI